MGRFNLLDEPWISVIVDAKGGTEEVSLKQLFSHAQEYRGLGGDTKTQDFAVFRVLLSVLHTVFSRFDANGEEYGYFDLDEKWVQTAAVEDEDDQREYLENLYATWIDLWEAGEFPSIVQEYLEKWRDSFYLFHEETPFFQVTAEDLSPHKLNKKKAGSISGKNLNRLISESANKIALFSPKYSARSNKELLTPASVARWLITFQGYTGLSDKVIFGSEKYKASKGWLFDIGGIYIRGENLFESLLLNCALVHPEPKYSCKPQRPAWEFTTSERVQRHLNEPEIDNLAELYTSWSRAVHIDPENDPSEPFTMDIVKLPDIRHEDQFLELMSLWRYNTTGENKDHFTPRKHRINQAVWRSFGLITLSQRAVEETKTLPQRKPGIMDWLNTIKEHTGDITLSLQAISMQDDGNATSWVPVDEIYDVLNIRDAILTDVQEAGWVPRINDVVEETKDVVSRTYRGFIANIKEIRNMSTDGFVNGKTEELYYLIDQPFREWLASLRPEDSKDERIFAWRDTLKKLVMTQAGQVLQEAGPRDYTGIVKDDRMHNIATAYNRFTYYLNKQLGSKGGE